MTTSQVIIDQRQLFFLPDLHVDTTRGICKGVQMSLTVFTK